MKRHLAATAAILVTTALLATGCSGGGSDSGSAAGKGDELKGLTGVIGSKDFSEQYILAYLTTDLLNAHVAMHSGAAA